MITLYYSASNPSCRLAEQWFRKHKIEIKRKRIDLISKEELIHVLSLSDSGFINILKHERNTRKEYENQKKLVLNMNFNDALDYILAHKTMLMSPIVCDENKLLIGYNSDKIREFIPRDYRRQRVI